MDGRLGKTHSVRNNLLKTAAKAVDIPFLKECFRKRDTALLIAQQQELDREGLAPPDIIAANEEEFVKLVAEIARPTWKISTFAGTSASYLGGQPSGDVLQWPRCLCCGERMDFVGQLAILDRKNLYCF